MLTFNNTNNISSFDIPLDIKYKKIKNILKRWNYIKINLEEECLKKLKKYVIRELLKENLHDYIIKNKKLNKEIIKLLKESKIIWE